MKPKPKFKAGDKVWCCNRYHGRVESYLPECKEYAVDILGVIWWLQEKNCGQKRRANMSDLLLKLGFWIASKGLNDLSQDHLTVESAQEMRDKIIGFIDRRYTKALLSSRITADDRWWWWWQRVLKSDRLQASYEDAKDKGHD